MWRLCAIYSCILLSRKKLKFGDEDSMCGDTQSCIYFVSVEKGKWEGGGGWVFVMPNEQENKAGYFRLNVVNQKIMTFFV